MKKTKNKSGFTLVELLIVIAIIGILTSIVVVSTRGGLDKSKRASAISSAMSVLPEIVACQDDGGNIASYNGNAGGNTICTGVSGHSVIWPATNTTGWNISAPAVSNGNIPDAYTFTITHPTEATVTCNLAKSICE